MDEHSVLIFTRKRQIISSKNKQPINIHLNQCVHLFSNLVTLQHSFFAVCVLCKSFAIDDNFSATEKIQVVNDWYCCWLWLCCFSWWIVDSFIVAALKCDCPPYKTHTEQVLWSHTLRHSNSMEGKIDGSAFMWTTASFNVWCTSETDVGR